MWKVEPANRIDSGMVQCKLAAPAPHGQGAFIRKRI
jgi:hypothetical protein